ncbi:MAG: NAD-dependent epimerase/dehydratase family protein [Candidatus Dormibacter sp.]|uniref:NAD-dependent epimerase/dehydratase family protein n=1 Tax=Candidatus Dormibacter sp. TaxID=2973982 RepID=UPI000DB14406|nr:MAG: hypothetical protein DLM66_13890 [Candidatus Dormibacteraeota bacterium]
MPRRRRILVTGVARWWGGRLVQRLSEQPDVAEVIGIDTQEPSYDFGRGEFLRLDIRHSLIGKLVRAVGIDTVVHTATTVDSFNPDPRAAHETNVIGTMNLLAGCSGAGSPVRRFVLKSSAHVYGAGPDFPIPLREDRRLSPDSAPTFVQDMIEVEQQAQDFALSTGKLQVLILRFANSLNAEEPQPLARYLNLPLVPTVLGCDPSLQLIHHADCTAALARAAMSGPAGAYNIAPAMAVPLSELLEDAAKLHAPLLPPLATGLTATLLRLAGITLSDQLLSLLRHGRVLSTSRATRLLKFRPELDTQSAYREFLEHARVLSLLPDRQHHQFEQELEEFIRSRAPSRRRG